MFNKYKFSKILADIYKSYNNQREFAEAADVNRAYLSQYINQKFDTPPSPKILSKIANASKGITTYEELMFICDYTNNYPLNKEKEKSVFDSYIPKLKKIGLLEDNINQFRDIYLGNTRSNFDNINIVQFLDKFPLSQRNDLERIWDELSNLSASKLGEKSSQYYMCPVYGQISAGQPNWAEECIEGRLMLDPNLMGIVNPEEHFFLRVNGESMNKIIRNGAFALIHKQDTVENGEIAVVLVNGYDATLKKFTRQGELIVLEPQSNDNSFETQVYDKTTPIKILGKYVGKMEINK